MLNLSSDSAHKRLGGLCSYARVVRDRCSDASVPCVIFKIVLLTEVQSVAPLPNVGAGERTRPNRRSCSPPFRD